MCEQLLKRRDDHTQLLKAPVLCALRGLISALGQCSNGLERLMHSPSARALSHPRPLLHRPRALIKPRNAHTTGINFKYYLNEGWNEFSVVHRIPTDWIKLFTLPIVD